MERKEISNPKVLRNIIFLRNDKMINYSYKNIRDFLTLETITTFR